MNARMPYTQIAKEALPPRLSVLGYVKVGGKSSQVRWGRNGPYTLPERYVEPVRFEVTTREKRIEVLANPKNQKDRQKVDLGYRRDEAIHGEIGEAPTRLKIRMMFPTAEENFICHFGAHTGRVWACQGNGVEAMDVVRGKVPCPCPRLKQFEGQYEGPDFRDDEMRATGGSLFPCKPRGILSMILEEAETFGGFHAFKTTSWESIANIRTQLELFEGQFGRIDGLPLELVVYPATKSYSDPQGGGTTTQPIVTIVLAASFDTARQIGTEAAERSRQFLLTAGGAPDPEQHRQILTREMQDEAESEGGEFFPGGSGEDPENPTPTMEERLRAKAATGQARKGQALPVVEADVEIEDADASGPDFDVVADPGEADDEEAAGAEELPAKEPTLQDQYLELLTETAPGWGDEERRAWQLQKIGKEYLSDFDEDDFQLGILLLKRGDLGEWAEAAVGSEQRDFLS